MDDPREWTLACACALICDHIRLVSLEKNQNHVGAACRD